MIIFIAFNIKASPWEQRGALISQSVAQDLGMPLSKMMPLRSIQIWKQKYAKMALKFRLAKQCIPETD